MIFPKVSVASTSVVFIVTAFGFHECQGFISGTVSSWSFCSSQRYNVRKLQPILPSPQKGPKFMQSDDTFDNDYDNEEEINPSNLGDWRTFRMNLAESGLPTKPRGTLPTEMPSRSDNLPSDMKQNNAMKPKSVSKENENILKVQNKKLADEYLSGVWAHSTPTPEVGSLVCRLPLEAEIHHMLDRNAVGKKLKERLQNNLDIDDSVSKSSYGNDSFDRSTSLHSLSFSPLAAQTIHWYKRAQLLVSQELKKVTDQAVNGRIDSGKLPEDSIEFLNMYLDNQVSMVRFFLCYY